MSDPAQAPPEVSLIVAVAANGVIGRDNAMPWHLPADLRHFRTLTLGKPVVMGRRTHESIGRALPGRQNIVVSRDPRYRPAPGAVAVTSLGAALQAAASAAEIMVAGGAELYAAALPLAGRIYLTEVHLEVDGDTRMPAIDPDHWRELSRERHEADERNAVAYSFVELGRVAGP